MDQHNLCVRVCGCAWVRSGACAVRSCATFKYICLCIICVGRVRSFLHVFVCEVMSIEYGW